MKLAITGMIASGKSEVLRELARLGWLTISADELARKAAGAPEAVRYLKEHFGGDVPPREELRRYFIENAEFKKGWENILHPMVNQTWRAYLAQNEQARVAAEIPLLFEKRLEKSFEKVVVCQCSKQEALQRWKSRGRKQEEYEALEGFLLPLESKLTKADFIIENNSTLTVLQGATQLIHTQILN